MLAQYLVLLGVNNSQKSKRSDKSVNSSQVNKERTSHVHMLVKNFCIVVQKYFLRQGFRLRPVLNFPSTFRLVFLKNCCYRK